jgi:hypothetical protein
VHRWLLNLLRFSAKPHRLEIGVFANGKKMNPPVGRFFPLCLFCQIKSRFRPKIIPLPQNEVARWIIFKPKIPIGVNFGGP